MEESKTYTHEIRDTIHTALELAEYTRLPFLLLGNPGVSKTTITRSWAARKGYQVVSLIGSQRTAEEILGYMVNNGERLVTFTPDWFDEIHEYHDQGHKTVLFIDELSTAPENVQGAMLQLIFDRKVGGRNYLPDDTIIISAANYKANLPPQNRIMAPTLNRFVIVNIEPSDGVALAAEFLQPFETREENLLEFKNIEITDKLRNLARENLLAMVTGHFKTFSVNDGSRSTLDVRAQSFDDIYEQDGKVYNFISGRSLHYLYELTLGLIHFGICLKKDAKRLANLVLGLVGAGTNTFKDDQARKDYQNTLVLDFQRVLKKTIESGNLVSSRVKLDFSNMSVEDAISNWVLYNNGSEVTFDDNFKALIKKISDVYAPTVNNMGTTLGTLKDKDAMVKFVNDMQKIAHLGAILDSTDLTEVKPARQQLGIIEQAWDGYKSQILRTVLNA